MTASETTAKLQEASARRLSLLIGISALVGVSTLPVVTLLLSDYLFTVFAILFVIISVPGLLFSLFLLPPAGVFGRKAVGTKSEAGTTARPIQLRAYRFLTHALRLVFVVVGLWAAFVGLADRALESLKYAYLLIAGYHAVWGTDVLLNPYWLRFPLVRRFFPLVSLASAALAVSGYALV